MRAPNLSQFRSRSRSSQFRFDGDDAARLGGPSTSDAAAAAAAAAAAMAAAAAAGASASTSTSTSTAAALLLPSIEDTSCSESQFARRRESERRARRALLRKSRPPRSAPKGPPLTPSSFATDRFGAYIDSALEKEFWDWLNPQAVKTDATTLLMLFGVVGSTALAFAWQQSPWCLYTGTLLYFSLAVAYAKYPEKAARYRMRVMPWVRVSVLLMTVCNTWARKGTPLRPVGFLPSWLGTSAVALDADEQDALLLRLQQQPIPLPLQQAMFNADPAVPFTFPPRATSLEEASEPANWITFFFKVPRVYAIALPGVGFLLPPRSHALSTLACIVLIIGSVKTAAADREAFLGREMHEIVAGVLSSLTTALLGSLSPVVPSSNNLNNGQQHVNGIGPAELSSSLSSLSSPPPLAAAAAPALPPLAASLLSSSTSLITGRRATVAFLAANQVMSCHWVAVIHAALVRRERRRFELMKRAEEEETETEGEEGDEDFDDDDGGNGSERPLVLSRRKRALSSATRLYLGRTAEIDWLIGQAALHAAGWVALWTAAEAWHRWKSGRLLRN